MNDFQKAVKRSLLFGFCGAVILPVIHECYANISKSLFTVIIFALAVISGVMFSKFDVKSALVSISVFIALTSALGICLYLLIHPMIVSFLSNISKYFRLSFIESEIYYERVILAFCVVYIVYGLTHLGIVFVRKTKKTNEEIKTYIDNAFND